MLRFIVCSIWIGVVSCSPTKQDRASEVVWGPSIQPVSDVIGKWKNIHEGNPELAGVEIQQYPDSALEAPAWEGGHPAMILFVMWDGRVNQRGYRPDGTVREDFWWDLNDKKDYYSHIWDELDFSVGGDPDFLRHPDPRKSVL